MHLILTFPAHVHQSIVISYLEPEWKEVRKKRKLQYKHIYTYIHTYRFIVKKARWLVNPNVVNPIIPTIASKQGRRVYQNWQYIIKTTPEDNLAI